MYYNRYEDFSEYKIGQRIRCVVPSTAETIISRIAKYGLDASYNSVPTSKEYGVYGLYEIEVKGVLEIGRTFKFEGLGYEQKARERKKRYEELGYVVGLSYVSKAERVNGVLRRTPFEFICILTIEDNSTAKKRMQVSCDSNNSE